MSGNDYVLVEYGEMKLDVGYRVRLYWLEKSHPADAGRGNPGALAGCAVNAHLLRQPHAASEPAGGGHPHGGKEHRGI